MGYEATFDGGALNFDPPLGHKAIKEWQADHRATTHGTTHFCSIVLDVEEEKADTEEGELVRRTAATAHIYDGGDLRANSVMDDIGDLVSFAERRGVTVSGMVQQTEGHPDENYPHRWYVRGNVGLVDVQKPTLIYPEDSRAIGVLAQYVQQHTGRLLPPTHGRVEANNWGSDEANEVATGMVRALTNNK